MKYRLVVALESLASLFYWPQHWLCSLSWRLDQRWKTGVWKETTEQDDK